MSTLAPVIDLELGFNFQANVLEYTCSFCVDIKS